MILKFEITISQEKIKSLITLIAAMAVSGRLGQFPMAMIMLI